MKPTLKVCNANLVPAETVWPGRCNPGDMVMRAELLEEHPKLGQPVGGREPIRTSLVVAVDFIKRTVETRNTVYQIVEAPSDEAHSEDQ